MNTSNNLYKDILSHISDAVFITDLEGRFKFICPNVSAIFGMSEEEVNSLGNISLLIGDSFRNHLNEKIKPNHLIVKNLEHTVVDSSGNSHDLYIDIKSTDLAEGDLLFVLRDVTIRKAAFKEIETEKSKLRIILDTIPDLVWIKDPQGRFLACNKEFEKFIGKTQEQIAGKHDHEFLSDEIASQTRKDDLSVINSAKTLKRESTIVYHDGKTIDVETTKAPFYDNQGALIGVLGIARDISRRKVLLTEIQDKNARINRLINSVDGIIWEFDPSTRSILYISSQVQDHFDITPEECMKDSSLFFSRIGQQDMDKINSDIETLLQTKSHITTEYQIRDKDNEWIWMRARMSYNFDEIRNIELISGVTMEFTQVKRMGTDLQFSESKLSTLFDSIADGIYLMNEEGIITQANPGAAKMTGYTLNELAGMHVGVIAKPYADRQKVTDLFEQLEPYKSYRIEEIHTRKDGTELHIESITQLIEVEGQKVICGVVRDMSERVKYETQLRQIVDEAPFGIILRGIKGNDKFVNKAFSHMLGYSPEEIYASPKSLTTQPEYDQKVSKYQELINGKISELSLESNYISKTGEKIPARIRASLINDINNPDSKRILAIVEDLREIRKEEDKRKNAEILYSELLEIAPYPILILNQSGIIQISNYEASRMLGYSPDQLQGMSLKTLTPTQASKSIDEMLSKLASGKPMKIQIAQMHADGGEIPIEFSAAMIKTQDQNLIFGIARDLRQQYQQEQLLRNQNEILEESQQMAKLGSWKYNFTSDKIEESKELLSIFESSHHDTMDVKDIMQKFIHPEDKEEVLQHFHHCVEHKKPFESTHRIITAKNNIKFIRAHVTFEEINGQFLPTRGVVQDITELERYRLTLEQDIEKLNMALTSGNLMGFEVNLQTSKVKGLSGNHTSEEYPQFAASRTLDELLNWIMDEHKPNVKRKFNELIKGSIQRFDCEFLAKHNENYRWYKAHSSVIEYGHENLPSRAFITLRDIEVEKNQEIIELQLQDQERLRISRDIHDSIGQMLVGTRMMLNILPESDKKNLTEIDEMLDEMIKESRIIINNFGISLSKEKNLRNVIYALADKMKKVYFGKIHINWQGKTDISNLKICSHIFRIYQEALSNAIKYSQSDVIIVNIRNYSFFFMDIIDYGKGYKKSETPDGFGTINMRERAREIGAALTIESKPEKGTWVSFRLH